MDMSAAEVKRAASVQPPSSSHSSHPAELNGSEILVATAPDGEALEAALLEA